MLKAIADTFDKIRIREITYFDSGGMEITYFIFKRCSVI